MALAIKKLDTWYLINNRVYITSGEQHDTKYINLALQIGPDMQYGNHDLTFIEYPGEYDINGIFLKVFAGKAGELNYLIQDGNKEYAFVQTEDALSNDEFTADTWLFTNPHIAKTLDKMELEGEKIDLTAIEA